MTNIDILNLYKKGYSLHYISKQYYVQINKGKNPIFLFNGDIILPNKKKTFKECSKYVYNVLLDFNKQGVISYD